MQGAVERDVDFTPSLTKRILEKACEESGLDVSSAVLLRHQTNGVYLLSGDGIIAKVARPDYSLLHIERTVELIAWLMRIGFPTVPLAEFNQPIVIDGSAVTLWKYLPQIRPMSAVDIGEPLRELHSLPHPPASVPDLPGLDAIAAIKFSLDHESILTDVEHEFLTQRLVSLAADMGGLHYEGSPCVLHGDPQHGNALWDGDRAVLSDWESVVVGPAEWDLVTIEIHCRRFGHPPDTYAAFCNAYGRDIRKWAGFPLLRDVRELRMIATNARKSAPGSPSAMEVRRRIAELRGAQTTSTWSIL